MEAPNKREPGSADWFPLENVGFNFAGSKWTNTQQKRAEGTGGGNVTGGLGPDRRQGS